MSFQKPNVFKESCDDVFNNSAMVGKTSLHGPNSSFLEYVYLYFCFYLSMLYLPIFTF